LNETAAIAVLILGALALACLWCVDDADPEIHRSDNPWSDTPDSRDVAPVPPATSRESGLFYALVAICTALAIAASVGASYL
jgi:hypothetical protein